MISDAYVNVSCDDCGFEIKVELTATARGYDERNVDQEIRDKGWTIERGYHYCADCMEQRNNQAEENEAV